MSTVVRRCPRQQVYFVFLDVAQGALAVERQVFRRPVSESDFREWTARPRMLPEHRRREVCNIYQHLYFEPKRAFYLDAAGDDEPEPRLIVLQSNDPWHEQDFACQRDGPGKSYGGFFIILGVSQVRADRILSRARKQQEEKTTTGSLKRGRLHRPRATMLLSSTVKKPHRVKFAGVEDPLRPERQIKMEINRKLRRRMGAGG